MMGIIYSSKVNSQEMILIKHNCKIISHGYFTFCTIDDSQAIDKVTFIYSVDLKKKSYTTSLMSKDTLSVNNVDKKYLKDYSESDVWNRKRLGTSVEKYFTIFHKDFLIWSNSEKLDFFTRVSKNEK
ncbi:hypothetical protein [Saccharicrinis fermentans]|nr:hypothetical protein [Saccharicrinis fermentans]